MIDSTWIAGKSLARMLMAAARVARAWISCVAHSLKMVWFLALSIASCPIPLCHVDFLAAGARGHSLRRDAVHQPT
jgi:hypothetical protein